MAVALFLQLDEVVGESTDDRHQGEMDLLGWSWGLSNSAGAQLGGGAAVGKVAFAPLQVTKALDQGSPSLMALVASGRHVPSGRLTVVVPGDPEREVLSVRMEDILVTSWTTSEHTGDERAEEEVTLLPGRATVTYVVQRPDGSLGDPVVFGWDVTRNQRI